MLPIRITGATLPRIEALRHRVSRQDRPAQRGSADLDGMGAQPRKQRLPHALTAKHLRDIELLEQHDGFEIVGPGNAIMHGDAGKRLPLRRHEDAEGRSGTKAVKPEIVGCDSEGILAAAGLLDGRRATTHWRYTDMLTARFPAITVTPDVLYVDAGSVLTSAGTAAGLDLCLHLIRRDFGTEAANLVARRLVMPAHRDGGQAQFIRQVVPRTHESSRLGPLLDHMREDLGADHTVSALARRAGMSNRTFLRRFESATGMTPARWLLAQRLGKARDLLEETNASVEEIAALSGFGTTGTLRHHFRLHLSTTPAAYREAFGRQAASQP